MKFFHVYNEQFFEGLTKNGLLNEDSGFKIQHAFTMPHELKFNTHAAIGTKLHKLIKENKYPFYIDRITGGTTFHDYKFDKDLIKEYENILGEWFLGVQLHESASNRRQDWNGILARLDGKKGPYDVEELKAKSKSSFATLPDGTVLYDFSQGRPEEYAKLTYAETPGEFNKEISDMYTLRHNETYENILPCDSYYMFTKLQNELGMKTFMPEVGWQIPWMRIQMALARGIAKAAGKLFGAYYETWIYTKESGYTMPCFNTHPLNEWYLTQEQHPDDFTSFGNNGGSSRLLQRRIYYHALMSGADYFSEEWGLNSSYNDMETFELSVYGQVKKDFINDALNYKGMKPAVPFAIVLPRDFYAIEIPQVPDMTYVGEHRDEYMQCKLNDTEKAYYGHIEDVIKFIFERCEEPIGNEGHTLTNSRFGDIFDIVYEDTPIEALAKYDYLIDATPSDAIVEKLGKDHKVLSSRDLNALEAKVKDISRELLPCTVDSLHWIVSEDAVGQKYLTVFNNEGNERSLAHGDTIDHAADRCVTVSFKEKAAPVIKAPSTSEGVKLTKVSDTEYKLFMPATTLAIIAF